MKPLLRCCTVLLSCAGLLAAEDKSVFSVSIPDCTASRAAFDANIIGQAWNDPSLDGFRAWVRQQCPQAEKSALIEQAWDNSSSAVLSVEQVDSEVAVFVDIKGQFENHQEIQEVLNALLSKGDADISVSPTHIMIGLQAPSKTLPLPTESGQGLVTRWSKEGITNIILKNIPERNRKQAEEVCKHLLCSGTGHIHYGVNNMHAKTIFENAGALFQPINTGVFQAIPEEVENVLLLGIDFTAWWAEHGVAFVTSIAEEKGTSPDVLMAQANGAMMMLGLSNVEELTQALSGTCAVFSGSPIGPYPSINMLVDRSPALDKLVTGLLTIARCETPAEGQLEFLMINGWHPQGGNIVPGGIAFGRTENQWVIGLDSQMVERIILGETGDWSQTESGQQVQKSITSESAFFATMDSSSLATLLPHAAGGLSNLVDNGAFGHPLIHAAHKIARAAGANVSHGYKTPQGFVLEGEGLLPGMSGGGEVAIVAVIAAIAVPNLLESRISAQESAAAVTLKAAVFPAQIAFQCGAYVDDDGDGIGSYTDSFEILSGGETVANGITLTLLAPTFNAAIPEVSGYRYKIILPEEEEKHWAAFAWPVSGDDGRRTFVITQSGNVYTTDPGMFYCDKETGPSLEDLNETASTTAKPDPTIWTPYRR